MDDEAAFFMQVAQRLRETTVRTLVAQQAYDRIADQLTMMAVSGGSGADDGRDPQLLTPDLAQATPRQTG